MSSWRECKLGELGIVVTGKTPSSKNPEDWGIEMPFVTPSDYKNYGKYALLSERNLSKDGISRLQNKVLPENSIMVTCIGSDMGKIVMNKIPVITNQQINSIIPDSNIVDSDFLYYRLVSLYETLRVYGSDGTAVPIVNKTDFENIETEIPPFEKQKAIAEILSSLDDKIDLLHRQNQTLESLAQTLFRQWFIEGAKEEWEVGILGDYIDIIDNRGKTPPFLDDETEYPIIEVNALSGQSRLINYSLIKKYVTEETYNSWFRAGHPKLYDTLLSTVGSIGEIAMFLLEKGSIAQNVVALRAKNISPFYLYENIKFMQNELKELDIGSVQPSIKVTHLVKVDFVKPDDEILKKFDEQMMSISNKVIINSQQIKTLENLRDTLLPKLLSGEVRVEI